MSLADIQKNIGFVSSPRFVVNGLQLRIIAVENRQSKNNSPYSVFKLADCSGETTGILWWDKQAWTTLNYQVGDIVTLAGEFIEKKDGPILNIGNIQVVDPARIKPECLLPTTWLPDQAKDFAKQFCWLYRQIQNRYLREFLVVALMNPVISLGYCSGQGSLLFHHNWPGGLLEHSVTLAMNFYTSSENYSVDERNLGIVVALMHDIGKTVTTVGLSRTSAGRFQPHDMSALEVLAQPLVRLDCVNPEASNHIRSFFKPQDWFPKNEPLVISSIRGLDRRHGTSDMLSPIEFEMKNASV
jgi:3'-5' exoribonuclease